jgi:hypothetical protein
MPRLIIKDDVKEEEGQITGCRNGELQKAMMQMTEPFMKADTRDLV